MLPTSLAYVVVGGVFVVVQQWLEEKQRNLLRREAAAAAGGRGEEEGVRHRAESIMMLRTEPSTQRTTFRFEWLLFNKFYCRLETKGSIQIVRIHF